MSAFDWGDAPTWAGAVFAAAAAGAAFWTLKSQRDQIAEQRALIADQAATLALERAALVDAAEDRKRAQAESVTWETNGWVAVLANHSNAPITDVRLKHPSETLEVGTVFEGAASLSGIGLDPVATPMPSSGSSGDSAVSNPMAMTKPSLRRSRMTRGCGGGSTSTASWRRSRCPLTASDMRCGGSDVQ
ncbi:hypothetical protein ACFV2H_31410 [Streptomyces sp. NPDC059629]|uniref:hypothetical protein n=1 Tax=Streptomyces sp. NPDC059629 TaxID=3346889 RepID=UPI00369AE583